MCFTVGFILCWWYFMISEWNTESRNLYQRPEKPLTVTEDVGSTRSIRIQAGARSKLACKRQEISRDKLSRRQWFRGNYRERLTSASILRLQLADSTVVATEAKTHSDGYRWDTDRGTVMPMSSSALSFKPSRLPEFQRLWHHQPPPEQIEKNTKSDLSSNISRFTFILLW